MSTIKVSNLQNASAASPAIVLDANSRATLNGLSYPTEGSLSGRNRIINGDMRIDQRNAGASVTLSNASNTFPVDRFPIYKDNSSATVTAQQSSVAPTGFSNSLLVSVTTGAASSAGQELVLVQIIEGFNVADLGFGAAGASSVTLSFWVRSSVTGTFGGALSNSNASRSYVFTYAINAANTWEQKSITIPGDTSGTWLKTNGSGFVLKLDLGAGSTYNSTAGSWTTGNVYSVSGAAKVMASTGATFYITGVQLEAGSVATPFERRSYGQELALCQRYYQKTYNIDVAPGSNSGPGFIGTMNVNGAFTRVPWRFAVAMRAGPTCTIYSPTGASGKFRNIDDSIDNPGGVSDPGTSGAILSHNHSTTAGGKYIGAHAVAEAEL